MTWDNWELRCENLFLGSKLKNHESVENLTKKSFPVNEYEKGKTLHFPVGVAGILILIALGLCCCGGTYGIVHFVRSRGN